MLSNMADGHDLLTSPKYKKLSFESININSINLLKDQADLVYDGKRVIGRQKCDRAVWYMEVKRR